MKRMQKIWILCLILSLMCVMYGCGNSMETEKEDRTEESVEVEIQTTEAPVQATHEPKETATPTPTMTPEPTATPVPEPLESLPPKVIEYGDKVSVTYTKTSQELQWEYTGMQEFQVATTSKQFQKEFDDSEEASMKQVKEAIGKTVGETFTLWFEGGDGRYGYEYTIVEVKSQNPDIAEYGDKLLADYSMTHYGVDTCDGEKIHTGQLPVHLLNTNVFFAVDVDGHCSLRQGDLELKKILGKTIGDQFQSENDYYEDSFYYQFTIKEINKAVKYGDTIVAEVREANTLDAKSYEEHSEEEWILDLGVMDGLDSLDGEILSLENIISLYNELIGKKAGDRVFFVKEDREKREIYNIMIQSVTACKGEDEEDDMEALFMAEEDELLKFYQYFDEYKDYFGDDPGTYSEPALRDIVIDDRKEQMVYEYYTYSDARGIVCHLTDKYEYTSEYDEKGRLLKETIRGSECYDRLFEYKYNEQGHCIEIIKYALDYEMHYYYDDMGKPIKAEYISDDNIWNEEYFY
ncbi:MAG: hypothetical protein IKL22_10200 [Lachnospiraceae bacterium]|nr:hypothetical protein [Lachnospiraceae bacterium]